MSMRMLTVLQIAGILAAYLGVTLLLPWILLRRKTAAFRVPVRFLICFMTGNFYVINLVLTLQLLHAAGRPQLIAGTLLPFAAAFAVRYRNSFLETVEGWLWRVRLVLEREMGVKTLCLRLWRKFRRYAAGTVRRRIADLWPDLLLTGGIIVLTFYMYGTNALHVYGYSASDIVVHNYWINEMGNQHIFAAGIYPFGFHCMIYYLHEVFDIHSYVLLRLFWVVQTLMIHLVLLAFLKAVCRSRYAPYAGIFAYIASDLFYKYAYNRFFASLPQEFGMLFILPSVYFVMAFLQKSGPEADKEPEEGQRRSPDPHLMMFAVCISMTLTAHFYDTIITALFCVGIAVGFCFRCFRWRWMWRIVVSGLLGLAVSVLPMGVAYAAGTSLEGSLYWAISVIAPEDAQEMMEEAAGLEEGQESGDKTGVDVAGSVVNELRYYMTKGNASMAWFMVGAAGALCLLGLLWIFLKRAAYGGLLISSGCFMLLLFLLQASSDLGLPELLEVSRYGMYIAYGTAVVWSLCLDAVILLVFRRDEWIHPVSLAALAAVCVLVGVTGIRLPPVSDIRGTNGAVLCLENIIHENPAGKTWTICSANDERQMALDYGYHYELISFLRRLADPDEEEPLTIPTSTVYFFIEKIPVLGSGEPVSGEGARQPLPEGSDFGDIYLEEARWIVMSHMYCWAEAFRRLYPDEMEVYYETGDFVCYRLEQNDYSLYDLAIDYGYN